MLTLWCPLCFGTAKLNITITAIPFCMGYFSVVVFAVAATFAKCSVYIVFVRACASVSVCVLCAKLRARRNKVSLGERMRKQNKHNVQDEQKNTRDT